MNASLESYAKSVAAAVVAISDPWDERLYAAVKERFESEARQLSLDRRRCEALCPDAPVGAFADL